MYYIIYIIIYSSTDSTRQAITDRSYQLRSQHQVNMVQLHQNVMDTCV